MIILTRFDKSKVLVSLANIKFVESTPDTLIRFTNGDMLLVTESLEEIRVKAEDFTIRCTQQSQSAYHLLNQELGPSTKEQQS